MFNPLRILKNPIYIYKLSRATALTGIPIIPSFLDYFIRFFFGCWLPHSAIIGNNFQIGYGGLGCIIHAKSVIGNNVHIGTNVTIGGNAREEGVPFIEDEVYIGSGAQVLGPIRIGTGSVIGANAVVTKNIEPRTVVVGNPSKVIKRDINIKEYIYHLRSEKR